MKVKLLNATHPDYDGEHLNRLEALASGGKAWRAIKGELYPQRFAEPTDVYQERLDNALYTNHAGGILTVLAAMLLSKEPTVEMNGDWVQAFLDNVDGGGTPLEQLAERAMLCALKQRTVYAWVQAKGNQGQEFVNRAQQEQAGALDTWVTLLEGRQVIDWEEDGQGNLRWVMVYGQDRRRTSIEAGRVKVHRWTYIDPDVIRMWEWEETKDQADPQPEDNAEELEGSPFKHGWSRLPVCRMRLPMGIFAMGRLEDPAIGHARARNDHSWALHQAANELLAITSKSGAAPDGLGHGHFLQLRRDEHGEDSAAFVAPTGTAFEYLKEDIKDWREEVYRVLQQMAMAADSDSTRMSQSGESKNADWRATEVLLSAYAAQLRPFLVGILSLVTEMRGGQQTVQVGGLEGYQEMDIMAFLESSALAVEALGMSFTFKKAIAKQQVRRLLGQVEDETVVQTILGEIDAAVEVPLFEPTPPPPADPASE